VSEMRHTVGVVDWCGDVESIHRRKTVNR
jgi:hypothetical protein